ncbi:MAG: glycosyltransferase family 4 protein [Parachlamydiaceae bacterium]
MPPITNYYASEDGVNLPSSTAFFRVTKGVNILGYFDSPIGHSESCRLITQCLKTEGIPVNCVSFPIGHQTRSEKIKQFKRRLKHLNHQINIFSVNQEDTGLLIKDCFSMRKILTRYNIIVWFWECDIIPKEFSNCLKYVDEIWVTSQYMYDVLLKEITAKLETAPKLFYFKHPIEVQPIHQAKLTEKVNKAKPFGLPEKFTFLFFLNWTVRRKNPLGLLKAFKAAFPNEENVQLVVKSQNSAAFINSAEFQELVNEDSRIIWLDGEIGDKRFDLMNACDCYISLHRSEGFGLTMTEAMLLGKPVIATGYSGNMDFMTEENSYLCRYKIDPVGAATSPYPENGHWAEPCTEHAAQQMRNVYQNYPEACVKAIRGKHDIETHHSYNAIGKILRKRLNEIYQKQEDEYPIPSSTAIFRLRYVAMHRLFGPIKQAIYATYLRMPDPIKSIYRTCRKHLRKLGKPGIS